MNTFTWKIDNMKRNIADGGVVEAHWNCIAQETVNDTFYSASVSGCSYFTPDASDSSFIAFNNLTEADVIGWVKADVNVSEIEGGLTASITAQKTPTTTTGLSWN